MAKKNKIKANSNYLEIATAIQNLEEIGATDSIEEYLDILNEVKADIENRILNAELILADRKIEQDK